MCDELSGAPLQVERDCEPRFFKLEREQDRCFIPRARAGVVSHAPLEWSGAHLMALMMVNCAAQESY